MGIWWSGIQLTSRSNCGEPCAGNLHARFLEEFISIVKSLEGEINLLMDYVVLQKDVGSGMIAINKSVFQAIAEITMKDIENVIYTPTSFSKKTISVKVEDNQLRIEADVRVRYGANVSETCGLAQSKIYENIVFMTGYKPSSVKINVTGFEI